tara:strand:+ start:1347 stop:3476 length:2130 start_codon:yes stop_codon:yes gene_type:complete
MNPKTSQDLFNKIRSQFSNIKIGDENGAATADASEAVFFEFEYEPDSDTFGSVSISIADGENMKVYYNRDLVNKIDESERDEWYAFLKELKDFAVEHSLTFDVRDITKSNLTKQDYQNLADTNKTVNTDEMSEELERLTKLAGVTEGLSGTAKRSYENLDKTRLIIRHTGKVDETVPGARSRQIQSLYIENEDGERFKYPLTHLAGARAMVRHVANGGRPHDEFGEHIIKTSEDIAKLNSFSRYVGNKDQLNDNAGDIIEQTKLKLENLREYMRNLAKQSHYENASKDFKTAEEVVLDDETANSYKDKFTMKNLDSRVEEALPIIHKIMSELEKEKEENDDEGEEDTGMPNSTIPTDQVDEFKDEDKPQPYADAGIDVVKFITDPNSKILLNKALPDEKKYEPLGKSGEESKMIRVLSDIASRMLTDTPAGDRVANFASRMSDQLEKGKGDAFKTKDVVDGPGFSKRNRDIAKALVAKYEKAAQEIDPADFKKKKDIKGKEYAKDPMRPEAAFEGWVDSVGEATIKPYVSMYKGEDGKMVYDVLDKDSNSAYKSGDMKAAQEYLSKNYDKLKEQGAQEDDQKISEVELDEFAKTEFESFLARKGKNIKDLTADEYTDMVTLFKQEQERSKKLKAAGLQTASEGNMFAQAVQKAKAAGMKAGDKFKVGDKEYTLKDAIELAGLQLEEFFSEEEMAYDNQIARIKNLSFYQ